MSSRFNVWLDNKNTIVIRYNKNWRYYAENYEVTVR